MPNSLQPHIKAILKLINPLIALGKIRGDDPESLQKVIRHLRAASKLNELENATGSLLDAVEILQKEHIFKFKRSIAEFINEARKSETSIREGDASWRVGLIELQLKKNEPFLRCLYNKEVVNGWKAVTSKEDVSDVYEEALRVLADSRLEDRETVFSSSLERQIAYRKYRKEASIDRIPIKDFYREVRTELLRRKLYKKSMVEKPIVSDFPIWAFLFNMDEQLRNPSDDFGISVETGSQADTAKGMALTLNGLDARYDYKQYCFIRPRTTFDAQ